MFRPPARLLHHKPTFISPFRICSPVHGRRALSFARPTQRSRSWKNTAVRWALAFGVVYIYNTTNVFAEVPAHHLALGPSDPDNESSLPTLDEVVAKRLKPSALQDCPDASPVAQGAESSMATEGKQGPATPQEYEDEAENEGAFNPETGEINWDCPCLGGMAHGPCGEEFKAAFSCFVYSKEEPKGMDCIERFKGMQDCFRRFPDVYGAELEDDDEEDEGHKQSSDVKGDSMPTENSPATPLVPSDTPIVPPPPVQSDGGGEVGPGTNTSAHPPSTPANTTAAESKPRKEELSQPTRPDTESGDRGLAPKAWHDERQDEKPK